MRLNTQQLWNIFNQYLGLRSGNEAENAAYAMDDFGEGSPMDIARWIQNPDSNPQRAQNWEDHLYNTIWKINDISNNFNLLILDGAHAVAESYPALGGRGDQRTFRKCNRVQPESHVIVERYFNAGEIDDAFNWVINNIPA